MQSIFQQPLNWWQGAVAIARDRYPSLQEAGLRSELEGLSRSGSHERLDGYSVRQQVDIMARLFGDELGFRGDRDSYYDPRNSYINDVLSRRVGIPISLSLVYCELARSLGVRAQGVSFPGHFLVRVSDAGGRDVRIVDPFYGGMLLDDAALGVRVAEASGGEPVPLDASTLAPASIHSILLRMLGNLTEIHRSRGDHSGLLLVLDRTLELDSARPAIRRERGLAAMRLGANEVAIADLAYYVQSVPEAGDVLQVRAVLEQLRGRRHPGLN